jgi:hypothetical protein
MVEPMSGCRTASNETDECDPEPNETTGRYCRPADRVGFRTESGAIGRPSGLVVQLSGAFQADQFGARSDIRDGWALVVG